MPVPQPITAGVLIGGKSTRMGTDKALLPWKGSTLLESVVSTARRVTDDCVLLGSADRLPDSLKEMPRLPDDYPGIGPIAGLHALLAHRPDKWCLLLSCDIPDVTHETIRNLTDHISPDARVVAYATSPPPQKKPTDCNPWDSKTKRSDPRDASFEPCCALYHASILRNVQSAITEKRYALYDLIASLPHVPVPLDPPTRKALHNVNTPNDYDELL